MPTSSTESRPCAPRAACSAGRGRSGSGFAATAPTSRRSCASSSGRVERDAADVVPSQPAAEVLSRLAAFQADADVVDVDLVLDRQQVDGAEQRDEPPERALEVVHGLVEGVVVGRVEPGHRQDAVQQLDQALALFAHDRGQDAVFARARAVEHAAEPFLGLGRAHPRRFSRRAERRLAVALHLVVALLRDPADQLLGLLPGQGAETGRRPPSAGAARERSAPGAPRAAAGGSSRRRGPGPRPATGAPAPARRPPPRGSASRDGPGARRGARAA